MPAGVIHLGTATSLANSDGKEMPWSGLTGWMSALTRPTHGF
jgi:hypothetical protein